MNKNVSFYLFFSLQSMCLYGLDEQIAQQQPAPNDHFAPIQRPYIVAVYPRPTVQFPYGLRVTWSNGNLTYVRYGFLHDRQNNQRS